jgi:hypothetical protein
MVNELMQPVVSMVADRAVGRSEPGLLGFAEAAAGRRPLGRAEQPEPLAIPVWSELVWELVPEPARAAGPAALGVAVAHFHLFRTVDDPAQRW